MLKFAKIQKWNGFSNDLFFICTFAQLIKRKKSRWHHNELPMYLKEVYAQN